MIRKFASGAATAALLAVVPLPALAGTAQTTQFTYYAVSGRTPSEIYRSILSRGPRVGGQQAIAATSAKGVQNYSLLQDGSACRVSEHRLTFRFTVQLPRPTSFSAFARKERLLWQQFAAFLKAHELQHTSLWLGCAAELDKKVAAIETHSCKDAKRQAESLWRQMKASCDRLQVSFDKEQRSELLAQPFMQRVMRGQ